MSSTLKRTLSVLMVVVMLLTAAPLQGFVGMELRLPSLSVFAGDYVLPDNPIDYSDITPNQYMAKVLLRHNYRGYYCLGEDAHSFKNEQYESSFNTRLYSAARGLHYPLSIDTDFMTGIALWEFLNFDPSEAYEKVLYKKDYYFAIIMSILDAQIKGSKFSENINNSYSKALLNLESITTKIGKTNSEIDLSKLSAKLSDGTKAEYIDSLVDLSAAETNNEFWNYYGKGVSYFKDALNLCNNVEEIVKNLGSYIVLAQLGEDIKNVLYGMYTNCESSNISMRTALYEAYQSCDNEFKTAVISMIETGNAILNYTFKAVVGQVWNACVSGVAGGFGGGLLLGQVIGKSLSNFAFSTDATKEQFYALGCVVEFEDLMVDTVRYFENLYKNDESSDNANSFIKSLEMLYAIYDLGDEYAISFLEIAYEKGFYRQITSWFFGSNQEIDAYKNNIRAIQEETSKFCDNLVNIEGYREGYEADAPSAYQNYFIDKSVVLNKPSYSKDKEIENIEFDYNVEESHYFMYSYVINSDKSATITKCHPASRGDIVIPKDIHGYAIRKIKNTAFKKCDDITSVTMNSTLREIGESAFYGCGNLKKIILNNGLEKIGEKAFSKTALTVVMIPKTVTSMGRYHSSGDYPAFYDIDTLKTVIFEEGMEKIPNYALWGSSSVTEIILPSTIKEIGYYAFKNSGISEIALPNGLSKINEDAFYGCDNLVEIDLPGTLTSIGERAFSKTALTSITIPETVTSLGRYHSSGDYPAFYDIDTLKTVIFEEGMEKIPNYALWGSSSVTEIILPSTIKEIGYYAFKNSGISEIALPNGLSKINEDAFYGCDNLVEIDLPGTLISIGERAFSKTALTSITIPKTVTSLGRYHSVGDYPAFYDIDTLKTVIFEYGIEKIPSYALYGSSSVVNVLIPNTVTEIGSYAFQNCTGIKEIYMPISVTKVDNYAFDGCTGLTDVYYPGTQSKWNEITVGTNNNELLRATIHFEYNHDTHFYTESIIKDALCEETGIMGYYCFCGASYEGVIPAKGHTMDDYIVVRPSTCIEKGEEKSICSLCGEYVSREIDYSDCIDENGDGVCDVCGGAVSIVIATGNCGNRGDNVKWTLYSDYHMVIEGEGDMYSKNYVTSMKPDYWDDVKTVEILDGVTSIGATFFEYMTSLESVKIADSVTEIGNSAFYYCENLTDINIPDSVTKIDHGAFNYCSWKLDQITIPESVAFIGELVFEGCYVLTDINVDENNLYYADVDGVLYDKDITTLIRLPADKTEPENFVIPNGVKTIDRHALTDSLITSITIPSSVNLVRDGAFSGYMSFLTLEIYYYGSPEEWNSIIVEENNDPFLNANVHYINDEPITEPSTEPSTVPSTQPSTVPPSNPITTKPTTTKPTSAPTTKKPTTTEPDDIEDTDDFDEGDFDYYLDEPTNLKAKNIKANSIKLVWDDVDEAESYMVYYSTNGKSWKSASATGAGITIKGLEACTSYQFKVIGLADGEKGEESEIFTASTAPDKVNLKSLQSKATKKVIVTWVAAKGANGYEVVYSTSKKFTKKTTKKATVKKQKTKKIVLKKLKSGKKYFIKVRAYVTVNNKKVYGAYSKVMNVKVK